jgi:hypothetical protein
MSDLDVDLDETVHDAVTPTAQAAPGSVAAFQPPRRRGPSDEATVTDSDTEHEPKPMPVIHDPLRAAQERRAAELRAAADQAAAAQRSRRSNRESAGPAAQPEAAGPDIESPFLELFDADAPAPHAVGRPARVALPAPEQLPNPAGPARHRPPAAPARGNPEPARRPAAAPGQPTAWQSPGQPTAWQDADQPTDWQNPNRPPTWQDADQPADWAGPGQVDRPARAGQPRRPDQHGRHGRPEPDASGPVAGRRPPVSIPGESIPPIGTPMAHPPSAPPRNAPTSAMPATAAARQPSTALDTRVANRRPQRAVQPAGKQKPPKPLTPPKRPKEKDTVRDLAISEIAGHLTFTQHAVTAWYWVPEVRWSFRPDAEREALLDAIAEQYAGLAGFRLHLRRTTQPFPAATWARNVDQQTPRPLPNVEHGTSWADHLVAAQKHLLGMNHAEGRTYLGVTFARRSIGDSWIEQIGRVFGKGTAKGERGKLDRAVEQFDEVLGAFGMRGRRATANELEWLLYRSVALCMDPPSPDAFSVSHGQWDSGDLLALTEQIERYRTPYGSTTRLVNRITGEERHVAVLTVGRMEPLEIPERHEPWLHFHERLPYPMELSSRIDILGQSDSFRNLEQRLRMIRSQQLDYHEHGMDAPPELERLAKRALVIGDEMTTGLPVDSARAHGWHRLAVAGDTREECLERARKVIALYNREMRVSLQHPKQQELLAREFIPGEPIANTGYLRRMPVKLLAAALPQAASTVGDQRGDFIGRTAGTSRRPVFLDLHFPMEVRERSGLAVFVAEPGGGKSTLLGALGYLAARRGVRVTLLDPSGPLARLAGMPEMKPYSRVINLTGSEQGTLAPYALIPTPSRDEFGDGPAADREFDIAVSNARAERRMLVQDICAMLVPPQVAREASTATLLRHAVRTVPAEETSTLDDIIALLRGLGENEGKELANLLLDTAEMPLALLFFGSPPPGLLGSDAALTVITMAGLRLPDLKIEREYWSAEEALALPMLHTAHRLAVRRCYSGDMHQRKLVGLDEAHFMEGWRSGRSFLVRLARDSRKWNLAALVASQNPKDILGLDVQNLVSTVMVGRIAEDAEIASEALRLLRVPTEVGYEAVLAGLSQADGGSSTRLGYREFVVRDVDGRVQKIRVDVSYVEGLLAALDTTPGLDPAKAG